MIEEWRLALTEQARESGIDIWPEHWHAFNVFLSMGTQWRSVAGFGGVLRMGLDYAALPVVLAEHRSVEHRQPLDLLMPQLRIMEYAALREFDRG